MRKQFVFLSIVILTIVAGLIWQDSSNDTSHDSVSADPSQIVTTGDLPKRATSNITPLVQNENKLSIKPIQAVETSNQTAKLALSEQLQQINSEFAQNDYHQILEYHNIVTLCQGIPKTAEQLYQWQIKHNDAADLDIELMNQQSAACQHVPNRSYKHLELIYRHAIKAGEPLAKLALAHLMPFDSVEKIQLLSESAPFSTQAVDSLAEKALTSPAFFNPEQRLFWLSLCTQCIDFGMFYDGEYASGDTQMVLTEIKARLDSGQIEAIEQRVSQWQRSTVQQRIDLVF